MADSKGLRGKILKAPLWYAYQS